MTLFCKTVYKHLLNNVILKNSSLIRHFSYRGSPFLEDIGELNVKYKVTNDLKDWQHVERTLAPLIVPQPLNKDSYPSGWKPQANVNNKPYFIRRTKNHMLPVYLLTAQRGLRRHTIIRKIQGDIFLLQKELKEFLQKDSFHPIRSQVHEFAGYIRINGDFVNACKYWLEKNNY